MPDYLFYRRERFIPEGGDHVATQVKYVCERSEPEKTARIHPLCGMGHPLTRDNFHTLVGQVASLAEFGDTITTIERPIIEVGEKIGDEYFKQVSLKLPLNPTELKILSIQVLEEIRKK